MILIAHRGNIFGPNNLEENNPTYIDYALHKGYDAEIDLWCINKNLYLGHDTAQYKILNTWIKKRKKKIWIHAKNIEAMIFLKSTNWNYFWHEKDTITLTSKKYIWAYPGKQKIIGSIAVMPEIHNDDISDCIGICTDYINLYEKNFSNNTSIFTK